MGAVTGTGNTIDTRDALDGRIALPLAEGVPEWIMWMPGGIHRVTGSKRGRPVTVTMRVDPKGAAVAAQAFRDHLATGRKRPWFDFDHKHEAASAWPLEYAWRDSPEPGIYARVEWSDIGREAIVGKRYRAFSPSWFESSDDPAEVEGAPLNMGSLVNDPAFEEIAPLWAKQAAEQQQQTHNQKDSSMNGSPTELAALQARIAELDITNKELQAKVETDDAADKEAVEAAKAELEAAKKQVETLQTDADSRKRRDADACVASAVTRGAIAPKDEAGQKRWRDLIVADPGNADLLSKQPGKVALTAGRIAHSAIQMIKPETGDIIRGYIQAATPREKGLLYRRELSPLIDKGENIFQRFPMEAVNTLGTVANALVSQRALELVVSKRPQLRGVTLDFSDEVKANGDTVKTRTVTLPTAANFNAGVSAATTTDVTVTLDLFKEVGFTFTGAEIVGTSRNLVAEHSEALALALGNSMVDALAALITEANFGSGNQTVKATASVDFTTITAITKAMNVVGVPDMYRFGWVNSGVAEALRNDEIVMASFDRGPMQSAYAHWTNVVGFNDIWEYPALPAGTDHVDGFFASRSALIVCARIPRSPTDMGSAAYQGLLQVITDPVSGLSVLNNHYIAQDSWNYTARLVTLYGVDLGQAACGHTLVHA